MTRKHSLVTRLWHWLNALCVIVLFMSGLGISNAHRYLYWGDAGSQPSEAWTAVIRFPDWATIPQRYDLAESRDWHLLFSWPFAVGLLMFWIAILVGGHFWRDLRTRREEWAPTAIWADIVKHAKLDFTHHGAKYSFLQKLTYGVVLGVLLPVMIFTGLAISPGFEPAAPWLVDIFGGRQSARSIHFLAAWALFAFFVIHIALVLLSGPVEQIRDMIAGGHDET
jgi:thiosulfate reductase cytochrome b subunit